MLTVLGFTNMTAGSKEAYRGPSGNKKAAGAAE